MARKKRKINEPPRAVVVNDDVLQLELMTAILEDDNIEVSAYERADKALSGMASVNPPDIIITDVFMPDIDGWRFCRLLRSPEYKQFNEVPILVVSATFSGDDALAITSDLGANAFMPAPVDAKIFLAQVRALLKGDKLQQQMRVLVVEDSKSLSGMLNHAFQSHGYNADVADSFKSAAALFRKNSYELAIIDYHLPDGKGDVLLEKFKKLNPNCVLITITIDPSPELALHCMKKGASAYIRKPFQPEYLIGICEKARRERALMRVEELLEERTRQLRESDARVQKMLSLVPDMVSIHDPDMNILYSNWKGIADVAAEKRVLNTKCYKTYRGYDNICPDCEAKTVLVSRENMKKEVELPGGTWVDLRVLPMLDKQGKVEFFMEWVRDITESKRLEEHLRQSHKMEALGTLAGGIAHEFNNILAGMMGCAEVIKDNITEDNPAHRFIERMFNEGNRAVKLVKQIAAFSKSKETVLKPLNIADTVEEALSFIRSSLSPNINIHKNISHVNSIVMASYKQIEQVLLNLCTNSAYAMEKKGGIIEVDLENIELDEENYIIYPGLELKRYVSLKVSDTGTGFDPALKSRIFDPFFTTKPVGSGTGMGLAVVHSIVEELDGIILVETKPGKGSQFEVVLPEVIGG